MAVANSRPWRSAALAGLGGAITIAPLAAVQLSDLAASLIPPFGASCVLVFGAPASPFARPRNVVGGHLISALMGLIAVAIFGPGVVGIALGVGLAIAAMMVTDTVHPPAGANPIVVAFMQPSWLFLALPVFAGAFAIVAIGLCYHRLVTRQRYPAP